MALAELQFIDRAEVVHLIGSPGTGKSHLSLALGVEAVKAGRSVYFGSLADIVATLAKAEREGTLRRRIRFLCRFALPIVAVSLTRSGIERLVRISLGSRNGLSEAKTQFAVMLNERFVNS